MLNILNECVNQVIQYHYEDGESDISYKQCDFCFEDIECYDSDEDEGADVVEINGRLPIARAGSPLVKSVIMIEARVLLSSIFECAIHNI